MFATFISQEMGVCDGEIYVSALTIKPREPEGVPKKYLFGGVVATSVRISSVIS